MTDDKDILKRDGARENPFTMPEGYLDQLQASLSARIEAEKGPRVRFSFLSILKPAVTMAAMFLLIFGMGYGVLALTGTVGSGMQDSAQKDFTTGIAAIDGGFLNSSFIDFYEDDVAMFEEEEPLSDDEIIDYLARELTYGQLAQLYDKYNIQ